MRPQPIALWGPIHRVARPCGGTGVAPPRAVEDPTREFIPLAAYTLVVSKAWGVREAAAARRHGVTAPRAFACVYATAPRLGWLDYTVL